MILEDFNLVALEQVLSQQSCGDLPVDVFWRHQVPPGGVDRAGV